MLRSNRDLVDNHAVQSPDPDLIMPENGTNDPGQKTATTAAGKTAGEPEPVTIRPNGDHVEIEVAVEGAPSNASFELLLLDRDEVAPPWYFTKGPTHVDRKPFPVFLLDLPPKDIEGLVVRCIGRLGLKPPKDSCMKLIFWQGSVVIGQCTSQKANGTDLTVAVNFAGQFQ